MPRKLPYEELFQVIREAMRRAATGGYIPEPLPRPVRPGGVSELVQPIFDPDVLKPHVLNTPSTPSAQRSLRSPFVSREIPSELPTTPVYDRVRKGEEPELLDAAKAMNAVLKRVFKLYSPSKMLPEAEGIANKPGTRPKKGKSGRLSMEDLRHEGSARLLSDVGENPARDIKQHIRNLESGLARWAEKRTATLSGEPRVHAEKRRLVEKAGQYRGRNIDDPEVERTAQWLESRGLTQLPKEKPLAPSDIRTENPEEVYLARHEPPADTSTIRQALQRLSSALESSKLITDRQRQALSLRYGLEGEGGELSTAQIGELMGVSRQAVENNLKGALLKLRKHIEAAGLKPGDKPERLGPPERLRTVRQGDPRLREQKFIPSEKAKPEFPRPSIPEDVEGGLAQDIDVQDVPYRPFLPPKFRGYTGTGPEHPKTRRPLFPSGMKLEVNRDPNTLLVRRKVVPGKVRMHYEGATPPVPKRRIPEDLPATQLPRGRRSYSEWKKQYQNAIPGSRLIPDPAGDVVIGNQRFRRIKAYRYKIPDPERPGKMKYIFLEEPRPKPQPKPKGKK